MISTKKDYGERTNINYFSFFYVILYKMESNKQRVGKKCVDEICDSKKINIFKGLPLIYEMDSTKLMVKTHYDDGDAGGNLLDSLVPDINVPIMKPSKGAWLKNWIKNAKCKMREASETIKRRSMQIAHWILNTKIMKSALPEKN